MRLVDTKRLDHLGATLKVLAAGGGKYEVVMVFDRMSSNAPAGKTYGGWKLSAGLGNKDEAKRRMEWHYSNLLRAVQQTQSLLEK